LEVGDYNGEVEVVSLMVWGMNLASLGKKIKSVFSLQNKFYNSQSGRSNRN
jgi:hypothetical protein